MQEYLSESQERKHIAEQLSTQSLKVDHVGDNGGLSSLDLVARGDLLSSSAVLLANKHIPSVNRQALASQIAHTAGNYNLQLSMLQLSHLKEQSELNSNEIKSNPIIYRNVIQRGSPAAVANAAGTAASVIGLIQSSAVGGVVAEDATWTGLSQRGGPIDQRKEFESTVIPLGSSSHAFTDDFDINYSISFSYENGVMNAEVRPAAGSEASKYDSGEIKIINQKVNWQQPDAQGIAVPYIEFTIRAHCDPYGFGDWWQELFVHIDPIRKITVITNPKVDRIRERPERKEGGRAIHEIGQQIESDPHTGILSNNKYQKLPNRQKPFSY